MMQLRSGHTWETLCLFWMIRDCVQIDLVKGMMDCLYAECKPCITDCVIAELEKLGQRYRVALKVAKVGTLCVA